jgi:hypothetical protein
MAAPIFALLLKPLLEFLLDSLADQQIKPLSKIKGALEAGSCRCRSLISLGMILLEQRPQFQRRPHLAVTHQRADAKAPAIELPRNNRCARFAALALLTASTSFASLTAVAWPTLFAQQLPAIAGTDARIVMPSDEGGAIECNHV